MREDAIERLDATYVTNSWLPRDGQISGRHECRSVPFMTKLTRAGSGWLTRTKPLDTPSPDSRTMPAGRHAAALFAVLGGFACAGTPAQPVWTDTEPAPVVAEPELPSVPDRDVHTHARAEEVASTHLGLSWKVGFGDRVLSGSVTHAIDRRDPAAPLRLDTRGLEVERVETSAMAPGSLPRLAELGDEASWQEAKWAWGGDDPILGRELRRDAARRREARARPLPHHASGLGSAVARAQPDRGPRTVPLQPVPGDPRSVIHPVPGLAGRAGHLRRDDRDRSSTGRRDGRTARRCDRCRGRARHDARGWPSSVRHSRADSAVPARGGGGRPRVPQPSGTAPGCGRSRPPCRGPPPSSATSKR